MKLLICGSRGIIDEIYVYECIDMSKITPDEIVSGGAKGVDTIAEKYATEKNIPIKRFNANWELHGKKAGPLRDIEMVEYADQVIAIWDGFSKGTKFTINYAKEVNKPCRIFIRNK